MKYDCKMYSHRQCFIRRQQNTEIIMLMETTIKSIKWIILQSRKIAQLANNNVDILFNAKILNIFCLII